MLRSSLALVFMLGLALASPAEIHKHALIIGVNGDGLNYADKDATDFASFIYSDDGGHFLPGNVALLTNAAADRNAVIKAIGKIGRDVDTDQASYPGDQTMVYIFVSGHSALEETTDEAYLMPWGADPSQPATGIRSDDFLSMVKGIRADHIVYFFDTCHAASSQNQGSASKAYTHGFQNKLDAEWAVNFKNLKQRHLGLFSSAASQKSYEDADLKHGIFTYYLLKGLSGEADKPPYGNQDGFVTSEELKQYLETFVPPRAQKFGPQTPQASLVWEDMKLSSVPGPERYGVYSDGAPAELVKTLQKEVMDGETVLSVSIASDNTWVSVGSKTYTYTAPKVAELVQDYRKITSDNTSVSSAILGDSGCVIVIFGGNGYNYNDSCPSGLVTAIKSVHEKQKTISHVLVTGQNKFAVISGTNGYDYDGLPNDMGALLAKINSDKQTVDHIAFGPNQSWVAIYDAGAMWGDTWKGMSSSFVERLGLLYERNVKIQAIAVQPSTNEWVIVAPN